ncbi:TRAP transporter substrate-binding protein DctP [Desulfopila sp. IMCC35008]|uniref:TRAP transporter substrate-binding protein DctP n=1 Tax=Desulfopila sp. IMCC35008 TaxID=2653858 RepID=UPI0013D62137|nr:TRAP transporter substrate-binding protein DctP [Desulfopila sp. IMCC35008]
MKKSTIALLLGFFLAFFHSGTSHADTSRSWKVGHLRQSGSAIDKDLHQFIEQVKKKTDNTFSFDVYTGNRLGDYSVVQERVSFGEVQLYVGPLSTSIDKRLLLATIPYLVNNWAEAQQVYTQGSDLFNTLAIFLKEQNIKLLGGWPVYFGGIALTKKPAQPGNPDVSKHMILRVPPIKSFELSARQLGYTPYPITWTYAKMGLKTGMVAGMIGGGAEGYSGLKDLVKYYLPVKDHFEHWFIYMNLDNWNNLSPQEQELFIKTASEIEQRRYRVAPAQEKESIEQLKRQGTEVIELSEKELRAMRTKVEKNVWPLLEKEIGESFSQIISGVKKLQ